MADLAVATTDLPDPMIAAADPPGLVAAALGRPPLSLYLYLSLSLSLSSVLSPLGFR
jgi:hypothetical protein